MGISVRRGREKLFGGLNLKLYPGHLIWLKGANGSGKTSLLRVAAGLSQPDEGEVQWRGTSLRLSTVFRSALLFLGHQNGLKDDLTAIEALAFLASLSGSEYSPAELKAALAMLGVSHRSHLTVRSLSQGQKKRVALARLALASGDGLWVLDEPLDALDPVAIETVLALVQGHLERRGCVLMTSHIPFLINNRVPEILVLGERATA